MAAARLVILENQKKKDGTAVIYAQVHIAGKSIRINTGVAVLPEKFDKSKNRVRGTSKEDKDNNLIIDKCLARINEILVKYRLQQKILTADLLLKEYNNPANYLDFYDFMDKKLIERLKNKEITAVSEKHQRVILGKLKEFKTTLFFAEIDKKLIENFRRFLRVTKKNNVNTIAKSLGYFKVYLNIAVAEGIIYSNPFDGVVFRRQNANRVYLTEQELKKLIKFYLKKRYGATLHRTLRHFLFMCLTGVRVSDLIRLKKENLQENKLKFVPYKTRGKKQVEITVPLVATAAKLINDEKCKTAYLFDTISEQKMNSQLKDITDQGGIAKHITNHSARHTFASLFLEKTNDVATLQRILGHSNIRETMVYVHISTNKLTDQIENFGRLINL